MIRPGNIHSLKEYIDWIATRWVIATLLMAFMGGGASIAWLIKTSSERETARIASVLAHAYRPLILNSAYRDAQAQMRSSGEILENEGLGLLGVKSDLLYLDQGTANLKPCDSINGVCWQFNPLRVSVNVPIFFDESTHSEKLGSLALTLAPRFDVTMVSVFGTLLIFGFLTVGIILSKNLKALGEMILEVIENWKGRIHSIDAGASQIDSQFIFTEFSPLEEEIKNLDSKIQKLEDEAARNGANLARFDLLRGLGHDLKTPISQLSKFVAILLEKQNQGLKISPIDSERVRTTLATLRKLIESVQDTTRINRSQEIPLEVVAAISSYCKITNAALGSDRVRLKTDTRSIRTAMNDIDLYRVLNNLVQNSLETNPSTSVEINLDTQQSNGNFRMTVTDNGPGIPAEIRSKVFDANFTTKPSRGTGLGLSIVKNLINQHQGTVSLNETQSGTSISVELPMLHEEITSVVQERETGAVL